MSRSKEGIRGSGPSTSGRQSVYGPPPRGLMDPHGRAVRGAEDTKRFNETLGGKRPYWPEWSRIKRDIRAVGVQIPT